MTYGDGAPIEQEKFEQVREELLALFGSFAVPKRRAWKYDGVGYLEIVKVEVITTGDQVTKKRLTEFKERLKESLQQSDILITSHSIQAI